MIQQLSELHGPQALLAWISLANIVLCSAGVLVRALPPVVPPRIGPWLALGMSFVGVYIRSFYRAVSGAPLTYMGASVHLTVALSGLWILTTCVIDKRAAIRTDRELHAMERIVPRRRADDWEQFG